MRDKKQAFDGSGRAAGLCDPRLCESAPVALPMRFALPNVRAAQRQEPPLEDDGVAVECLRGVRSLPIVGATFRRAR